MSYAVSSASANNVGIAGFNITPAGITVDYLDQQLLLAKAAGLINISPDPAVNEPPTVALTSGAGTPSTTTTVDVGGAFAQATLNNNFATLVTLINKLVNSVNNLQAQVRAHELRIDPITRVV